jgi:EAL domain-containing protein (putative c-di-GMP-specific phosphodiesterase class I)
MAIATPTNDGESRGVVLVVDDEAPIRAAFARILKSAGFETEGASNGKQAVELLAARRFDAILSDIAMPQMDGIGLLRAVRERDLDVPIILVTGSPSLETALKAVEYGALRYLRKPIEAPEVVASVEHAVRLGRMARLKREALELYGDASKRLGDRAGLEVNFERALAGLWMAYQPIVHYRERRVIAFEALMRSSEPMLPNPGVMLDAAQRLDRLSDLGRAIRQHVARTVIALNPPEQLFVNLHPQDLLDEDTFSADSELGKIASKVVLEITERAPLEEVKDLKMRVDRLRKLGFRIAIDDIGAGYAGLASIAQLEPEVMKIDMALIRDIDREPTKQKLVAAITALCREMQVLVIAEGIETTAERDVVVSLGCDLLQGYLFARPGPPFPTAIL